MTDATMLERAGRAVLSKTEEGEGVSYFYRRKMDKSAYEVMQDDGSDAVPYDGYPVVFSGSAEDCSKEVRRRNAVEIARAVLMAVREPDTDVCFVGDQLVGDHGSNGQGVFTAMIDAILADGEGR